MELVGHVSTEMSDVSDFESHQALRRESKLLMQVIRLSRENLERERVRAKRLCAEATAVREKYLLNRS